MQIDTAAMVIAVFALVWQMHQSNKQSKMHFFSIYTQRYQDIVINLPIGLESSEFSLNSFNDEKKEEILRWIRAYFDLCSEEYHLNKDGFIDNKIWKLWDAGMKDSLRKPAFIEAWKLIQINNYYDSNFAEYVINIQGDAICIIRCSSKDALTRAA